MMKRIVQGARLVMMPLALVACGAEESPETEQRQAQVAEAVAPPIVNPKANPDLPPGPTQTTRVTIQPLGGSNVSGEAAVAASGDNTDVSVRLTGLQPNARHDGHVHQGTCDAPGSVVAPLQAIVAGPDGTGEMNATLSLPHATVANGNHIIVYHEAGGNPGAPVACGQIPMDHAGM